MICQSDRSVQTKLKKKKKKILGRTLMLLNRQLIESAWIQHYFASKMAQNLVKKNKNTHTHTKKQKKQRHLHNKIF